MNERERLIDLLKNDNCPSPFICDANCKYINSENCQAERIADYLLENGVIVPVVEIGTTVYEIRQKGIGFSNRRYDSGITTQKQLKNAIFDEKTLYIESKLYAKSDNVRLGKTVFLTREEAEKALAERKSENETR